MDALWAESEKEFRRTLRRVAVEALLYPGAVVLAGLAGATVLARVYPEAVDPPVLLRDLWWAATVLAILSAPLVERYLRFRARRNWYRVMAMLCDDLAHSGGLVTALERTAGNHADPPGSLLAAAAFECAGGAVPADTLQARRCPAPLVRCVRESGSETDLVHRLRADFRDRAERTRRRLRVLERLAPAVATAAAGTVLLWLVIRLVLPALTILMTGGLYD